VTVSSGSMGVVTVAILSGLFGAYGLRLALMQEETPSAAPAKAILVPLASTDLPAGRIVKIGDIGLNSMTPQQFHDRMNKAGIPFTSVMMSPQQVVGRVLQHPVKQGEPFLTTGMYLEGTRPDISELLKPGFRAVSLQLSDIRGGSASPGSFVDVLFRSTPQRETADSLGIPEVTLTLFEAVEVLTVDQPPPVNISRNDSLDIRFSNGRSSVVRPPPTVTLAVTLEQANMLRAVEGRGEISLVVRSPDDKSVSATRPKMTLDQLMDIERRKYATEIYRRGSKQTLTFRDDGSSQHAPAAVEETDDEPMAAPPIADPAADALAAP
jgi:Flp pilus assembly protein CpaB